MFKISHKLNYFSHVNIFSRFRNKQKMPVVEKPLVSYMLFKKHEPSSDEIIKELGEQITETASSILGFSGILSSISDLSDAKRKAAVKQEQKIEEITSTQTQCLEKTKRLMKIMMMKTTTMMITRVMFTTRKNNLYLQGLCPTLQIVFLK